MEEGLDTKQKIKRIAIVGSRNFHDYERFKLHVDSILCSEQHDASDYVIISGGAQGADTLAERYAKEKGYELVVYRPNWKTYGKRAGIMRNTDIINDADMCIAFPSKSGRGTQDSIRKSKTKQIACHVFEID